ncbi:MAG: hypothetical protein ABI743_03535 [bacterium]
MRPLGPIVDAFLGFAVVIVLFLLLKDVPTNRDAAREAEVKSNLQEIKVALDRYAVDSNGLYPLVLYGGDPSDTFATTRSAEVSEFPGDVDWLLESKYLEEYPQNPFRRGSREPLHVDPAEFLDPARHAPHMRDESVRPPVIRPRVSIWAVGGARGHSDRSQQWIARTVGGRHGDRMWDVSGGQRHIPFPVYFLENPAQRPCPHDDPLAGASGLVTRPQQCWLMPGNFYYYATFSGLGNYGFFQNEFDGTLDLSKPNLGVVTGYMLATYGSRINLGHDVYNIWGDYPDRSLNTINPECPSDDPLASLYEPVIGPDSRPDGVILVLQSGADRKAAINQDDGSRLQRQPVRTRLLGLQVLT